MTTGTKKEKKKRETLSSFTILALILIVLAIITSIMGAVGTDGITGATIADVTTAPILGFGDALPVCLFVLILGGFLGIVTETGALDAGIAALVHKLKGRELILVPILMFLFSIGGTTFGMCEETVPFYLLLAATMVAAGFDSLTGAAIVLLGAGCGVLGSTVNPFAVGVAIDALKSQGIDVNQGIIIALGVVLWLVTTGISIAYVMHYAKKVKADKGSCFLSLQEQKEMMETWGMEDSEEEAHDNDSEKVFLTGRQKWTLVAFGLTFVVMICGFIPWSSLGFDGFDAGAAYQEVTATVSADDIQGVYDEATSTTLTLDPSVTGTDTSEIQTSPSWSSILTGASLGDWYFDETSTWFLLMAIVIGIIGGLGESKFVKTFINGAADMMSVVLVIAMARSITILMGETGLDYWILNSASHAIEGVSAFLFAPLSFLLFVALSFLIPSSSGMATVAMPIMGGLANQLGFSVETMVMIFSAGNGLVNLFTPTSAAIMGGLAMAKIQYTTWLKFGAKLFVILGIACIVILTASMLLL